MSVKQALGLCGVMLLILVIGGAGCVIVKPLETFVALEKIKKFFMDLDSDAKVQKLQDDLKSGRLK